MSDYDTIYEGIGAGGSFEDAEPAGTIRFTGETLRFEYEGGMVELPLAGLRVKHAGTQWIHFSSAAQPGCAISCPDFSVLQHPLFTRKNDLRLQAKRILEQLDGVRRVKVTLYSLAAFCLLALVASQVGGWAMDFLARKVPVEWEIKEGGKLAAEIKKHHLEVEDAKAKRKLSFVVGELARVAPEKRFPFKIDILQISVPNAFAVPGGQIYVTQGLMDFAQTPDELAFVLAHEIAHINRRHAFRRTISTTGVFSLLRTLISNRDGFLSAFSSSYEFISTQSFSRGYEEEADSLAWDYLLAANINPRAAEESLRRIGEEEKKYRELDLEAFASHPLTETRIEKLAAKTRKLEKSGKKFSFRNLDAELAALEHSPEDKAGER